jgi:hypothetical protein
MASAIYPNALMLFLSGQINLTDGSIALALINTSAYSYNATHTAFSSVNNGTAVVGTPQNLTNPTVNVPTAGVFNASAVLFNTVIGPTISAMVIYQNTGYDPGSALIAYIDGFTAIVPNSGNVLVTWDTGVNRIFSI